MSAVDIENINQRPWTAHPLECMLGTMRQMDKIK